MEEAHAYFGPGSGPQGAKKPTVSTHRGGVHFHPSLALWNIDALRDQRPIISAISSRRQNRIRFSSKYSRRLEGSLPLLTLAQNRHFVAVSVKKPSPAPPAASNPPRPGKRTRKNDSLGRIEGTKKNKTKTTGKRKGKAKATDMQADEDLMDEDEPPSPEPEPRRSKRQRKTVERGYNEGGDTDKDSADDDDEFVIDSDPLETAPQTQSDDEDDEAVIERNKEREPSLRSRSRSQSQQPGPSFIDLEVEEEEMKPKPQLQLSFNGFNIFGRCLCVIVEPWPVIRAPTEPQIPQSSRAAANSRASSIALDPASGRGQTPLFLPDDDDRRVTPAPPPRTDRPPVPLFNDPPPNSGVQEEEDEEGGMMRFSELLSATGGLRMDADDEDGFDGAILFGDADERKELS